MGIPPASKNDLTPAEVLCERLVPLIGEKFPLTLVTKTDGNKMRKKLEEHLSTFPLPEPAPLDSFKIIPPKCKGVPKIQREFIDSNIVTSGKSYNLQVWNRNPSIDSVQIEYTSDISGDPLLTSDCRFVLTKVNTDSHLIDSIAVLTGDYIVSRFGKFGKPTVKYQLIISNSKRQEILSQDPPILFYSDDPSVGKTLAKDVNLQGCSIHDLPESGKVIDLKVIKDIVAKNLIGFRLDKSATKNRGQALELAISQQLGYSISDSDLLAGGYPDIRHQLLEVKVQDSPTVDFGKYTPQFEEELDSCLGFKTTTTRYLIALTDPETGIIEGAVLCPGNRLGEHFTHIAEKSYKCQRSIPMSFFDEFKGQVVFNPPYTK